MAALSVESDGPGSGAFAQRFAELGSRIVAGHQDRIRQPVSGDMAKLAPGFAFHSYGTARFFIATRDGADVARASASVNPSLAGNTGQIGMFEAVDQAAAAAIIEAACEWLAGQGADAAVGPMDFSTWYSYRLRSAVHHPDGVMLEPDTPAAYLDWWEAAGFETDERYFTDRTLQLGVYPEYTAGRRAELLEAGFQFRDLDMDRLDAELRTFWEMSLPVFSVNPYYTPCDWPEFKTLYAGLTTIVDPRLVVFLVDPDGAEAGFVFAVPNFHAALHAMRGSRGILAKARFLRHRRSADSVLVKTLVAGINHQSGGVGSVLVAEAHRRAAAAGYRSVYHVTMHDSNYSRIISRRARATTAREYVLMRRALSGSTSA